MQGPRCRVQGRTLKVMRRGTSVPDHHLTIIVPSFDHHLRCRVEGRTLKVMRRGSAADGARPVYSNHLDDKVDSDQEVVNEELSLFRVEP